MRWQAPLAWSADARSLVVARGQPFAPLAGSVHDLATGASASFPTGFAGAASASLSADGGWLAVALTERAGAASGLPAQLGFVLAPLVTLFDSETARFAGTHVLSGEPWGGLGPVELGEHAGWGEPTGIALDPAGTGFVLGQRRSTPSGVEERLLEVILDCREGGS
jgi:hypothetical protein